MTLDRQIQRRVGGMQVPHPGCTVRQPLHRHRPEHRLQRAGVAARRGRATRPHRRRHSQDAAREPRATPDGHRAAAATAHARRGQRAPRAPRARGRQRRSRPRSSPATRTAPDSTKTQLVSPDRRANGRYRSHLPLHHHSQAAPQAGLQCPSRKVHQHGCRDRRSRWPPPWSTLDMSNADFDTLHMTPRPRPGAQPSPAEPLKTRPQVRPNAPNPGRSRPANAHRHASLPSRQA